MKLCECGCGRPAPLASRGRPNRGQRKGEPVRFIKGHKRDQLIAADVIARRAVSSMKDDAGYTAIHKWLNENYPRSGVCEECGTEGRTEYACLDHLYRRSRDDYRELCRRCHARHDREHGLRFQPSAAAA